jgi:hypothetical protein
MSRLRSPAAGALALAAAALGLVAGGCSSSGGHPAATALAGSPRSLAPCKLSSAQRRGVARALADIRRLRRLDARLPTYTQHGAPNENVVTGELMMDLGTAHLPPNVFANLLHRGKDAVRLCGDCFQGLEADEPFLNNRDQKRCG